MADITLKEAMLQKVDEVLNRRLPALMETLSKMDAKLDRKFAEMPSKMDAKIDSKFAEMLEMIRLWKMNRCANGHAVDLPVHKTLSHGLNEDITTVNQRKSDESEKESNEGEVKDFAESREEGRYVLPADSIFETQYPLPETDDVEGIIVHHVDTDALEVIK